jgi:hypothetical protein
MSLDREIGRALDRLADSTDVDRVACLLDVAELLERLGDEPGNPDPLGDRVPALVYRMIADADLVATGRLTRRHATDHPFNTVAGDVFDDMAAEPDLRCRATHVRRLVRLVDEAYRNDIATESVALLPYGGLVGGDDEMYWPNSFPKLVRNAVRRWRETRDA